MIHDVKASWQALFAVKEYFLTFISCVDVLKKSLKSHLYQFDFLHSAPFQTFCKESETHVLQSVKCFSNVISSFQVFYRRQEHVSEIIWARSYENVSYAICEQQRCRSACGFAQSDQHLCFRCLDSTTPLHVIFEISRLQLASVAEQADLNLTWSKIPEDTFSRDVAHMPLPKGNKDYY